MFDVVLDVRSIVNTIYVLEQSQLPFAVMRSLNEMGKNFQSEEQSGLAQRMTVRRPWVLQGVKIDRGDFATKDKLSIRIHIDDARDFLDKFEDDDVRNPRGGSRSLAVPVSVRRTKGQIIRGDQRPKSFHFQQGFSSTRSRWTVLRGDRHTFLLQRPDGSGLILQRTSRPQLGPSRHGLRTSSQRRWGHDPNLTILWNLRPTTRVPRLLRFGVTAQSVLSQWPGTFEKWYIEALRTAR